MRSVNDRYRFNSPHLHTQIAKQTCTLTMMKLTVRHFVRLKSLPDAGFELFLAGFDEG